MMDQCTHVVIFNSMCSSPLPSSLVSYPHLRIVKESWLETCFQQQQLVDETPYIIQSHSGINSQTIVSSVNYMEEWKNDIQNSISTLFDSSHLQVFEVFKVFMSFI